MSPARGPRADATPETPDAPDAAPPAEDPVSTTPDPKPEPQPAVDAPPAPSGEKVTVRVNGLPIYGGLDGSTIYRNGDQLQVAADDRRIASGKLKVVEPETPTDSQAEALKAAAEA